MTYFTALRLVPHLKNKGYEIFSSPWKQSDTVVFPIPGWYSCKSLSLKDMNDGNFGVLSKKLKSVSNYDALYKLITNALNEFDNYNEDEIKIEFISDKNYFLIS